MTPGDETHLTLLMSPVSLNFVTGQDREHLLAFGRAAFEAGQKCQGCVIQQGYVPVDVLASDIKEPTPAPFGYVNTYTGQFFKEVEPCRKSNEGHWRTVYEHPAQLAAVQQGVQPVATITGVDEFGSLLGWHQHWVNFKTGTNLYTHPTQQGLDAREFPAMTPELASILGLMCFQCISFAQALRAGGQQIDTRAEDEQAAVLHWMLGHYFRHGEAWRDAAAEDMERMKADAIAAQAKQGGV